MKRKQQSLCWGGDRKKFKCDGDGDGDGDDDDEDDDDGGGDDDDGGDDGDAGDGDDDDDYYYYYDDDDDHDDDDDDGGGGSERASNLFLRANQPSSEALSHQNPITPNLCQKQISRILRVSNTERRRQESIEHLTLLLSRLNCSTLTMIGWTVL